MVPSIAIVLTDAKRKIIWVNDGFTKMTGYSLPEVVGKKPSILQGPESESNVIERIRKCLDRKIPLKEYITNYRKMENPTFVNWSYIPFLVEVVSLLISLPLR